MPIVSATEFTSATVDYLIVGGGSAGLALAARLTEDSDVVVGVVEAGDYHGHTHEVDIPGMTGQTIANPKYDWTFFSTPQTRANNRVVLQPRGKGLGGSSLINFLGLLRPSKDEFDALEEFGNEGWNWESLLKYMKKSEKTHASGLSENDAKKYGALPENDLHGTDGPILKSFPSFWTELHGVLFDTAEALGVPRNLEPVDGNTVGTSTCFASIDPRTATRSHAATGYFEPNHARKNLLVLPNAQVLRVVIESDGNNFKRASGVEFVVGGVTMKTKNVKRDVILSAGSFQTPQLLELSGIGNPDILKKFGIETAVNLPSVGENLQDHVYIPVIIEVDQKYETLDVVFEPAGLQAQQELYKEQKGFMSSVAAPAYLFLAAQHIGTESDVNTWQAKADASTTKDIAANVLPDLAKGLQKQYDLQKRWFLDPNHAQAEILDFIGFQPFFGPKPVPGKRYQSLIASLMHPLSRGTVHLASSNPLDAPAINPNYFANDVDLDLMVRILDFTLKICDTKPFSTAVQGFVLPPSDVMESLQSTRNREEVLREYVRQWCGPVYHPVGTAAMMPRDEGGVVDGSLKVYGTTNLRVVDISVLPLEISSHTQSAAYAIGEKAADILKGERL
ncbi:alcohol oxidase [Crucibulum laeve]|uniref:pyranose dehydrogenase (acceptor) n=1 Tax=Crucibulum laeve TaxID=68775 RepID=A0A5C3LFM9_9AGAR|nr:alcohol oxidase [Crucibulum laeve]